MKYHHLALIITISGLIFSCRTEEKKNTEEPQSTEEPVEKLSSNEILMEYNALKDSADYHWATLDSINDEMVLTMNRLLDEVSYNEGHDATQLKALKARVAQLKANKLKQIQLSKKDHIDMYDLEVTETADAIITFTRETPQMMEKYPLSETLIEEINELNNNSIAVKRSDYDDHAFYYNKFLKKYAETLQSIGMDITPYPTFSEIITEDSEPLTEEELWKEEENDSTENETMKIEM